MRSLIFIALFVASARASAVPAEGHKIMISGASPYAIAVGKQVAEKGGNVVDVAVAVSLTLSVTSPYFGSLGGGGFALVKHDGLVSALDFREVAPKATGPKFYLDKAKDASTVGGAAVGVPGTLAGLEALHKKYGKLHWNRLFFRPIQMAQKGFRVSGEWVKRAQRAEKKFSLVGKKTFLKADGSHYKPGEKFRQKSLARALKEIRNRKSVPFYTGMIARDIVQSVQKTGGVLTLEDMKKYKVRWLEPLTTEYQGHKIYLMPPPSSGGVVLKSAFYIANKIGLHKTKAFSVDEYHKIAETLSRSFRGRALLGDPAFFKNPMNQILSRAYLDKMAASIDEDESEKLDPLKDAVARAESPETTHFSVMDSKGNAVAMTITLNGSYGSGIVSEKFGIALNNEMDDFTTRPGEPNMFGLIQGNGNYVEPGKRPLSSMSPTIVEKDGRTILSAGSPGGPRIISGVFQVIYRILSRKMDVDMAIQSPRVHHQFLPHKLYVDMNRFSPESLDGLRSRKHEVEESWSSRVYVVHRRDDGILEGAFDSRTEGAAGGF